MASLSQGWTNRITLAALLLMIAGAAKAAEPARLIEVDVGKRMWMDSEQIRDLSVKQHAAGKCGGFMDVTDTADEADALFANATEFLPLQVFIKDEPTHRETVERLMPELSPVRIMDTVRKLSSFSDRYYNHETGRQSAQWIHDEYSRIGQSRKDISVSFFQHRFMQPSVIARIEGKSKPQEIIIIGGHQDSINQMGGDLAPGADDDASGSATVLEIFRVLAESGFQPERTLEFMAYAGEEAGLLGSQDIAVKYRKDNKAVVAVLQFDMTMFPGKSKDSKIVFISDHVNPELTDFSKKLVDSYVKIPWATDRCGYACSDHASWTKARYPSAFPFEASFNEYNHAIHTEQDTIDLLDANFGLHFAKLGLAFAIEMAD